MSGSIEAHIASGTKHYNYFRDYDPGIGRYVESDPIGLKAGVNLYAYVIDDPLIYSDRFGLANSGPWPRPGNGGSAGVACDGRKLTCLTLCTLENQMSCGPMGAGVGSILGSVAGAGVGCFQPELAYPTYIVTNAAAGAAASFVCGRVLSKRCKEQCGGGPMSACHAK